MNYVDFLHDAHSFLDSVFCMMEQYNALPDPVWEIDHICFRVETIDQYLSYGRIFSDFGNLLAESPVAGRPVSVYKLHNPILYRGWKITLLELPAPKDGKTVTLGFEHIEVVCDIPFSALIEKYPQCSFDCSGLEKAVNQELEFKLGSFAVKFHHQSLEEVIAMERNQ